MNNKTFIQRYPVASYFFLAFLISWVGSFLAAGPKFLRGETMELTDIGLIGLPMMAGPSLASILMTYLVDGRLGFRNLLARMKIWRICSWYAALLIFPSLILTVSLLLAALVSPEFTPIFFAVGILMGLLAGFIEETGWMGFAFHKMELKRSILSTSIYLGFLHGLWHLVADFLGNSATFGEYWPPYFIAFTVFVMALRLLIVWVYVNTKSLLLAQLMHASSTGFLAIIVPMDMAPAHWLLFYSFYAVALWAVVTVVIVKYSKNLMKRARTRN